MKKCWMLIVCCMIGGAGFSLAQTSSSKPSELRGVTFKKIRSPGYSVSSQSARPGSKGPDEWLEIRSQFSSREDWADEVTLTYYLLMEARNPKWVKEKYNLFKGSVTYADVAKASRIESTVYLSPAKLARYGVPKGIRVELTYNGTPADAKTSPESKTPWWSNYQPQGTLLRRSQSPFANIDTDYYPEEKPETTTR